MTSMDKKKPEFGLLIDYEYCTGCHACEIACSQEYTREPGVRGIRVLEVEQKLLQGKASLTFIPYPTELCILCPHLTGQGMEPACVKACMAACMTYGSIAELAQKVAEKPKMVLWAHR
jgi:Fe-S-cluster-containing dehydrogenase component